MNTRTNIQHTTTDVAGEIRALIAATPIAIFFNALRAAKTLPARRGNARAAAQAV
jgi:hypothetical protein